jgi:hypothetical protein
LKSCDESALREFADGPDLDLQIAISKLLYGRIVGWYWRLFDDWTTVTLLGDFMKKQGLWTEYLSVCDSVVPTEDQCSPRDYCEAAVITINLCQK